MEDRKRRREKAYYELLDAIRDRALRFLQVAPALEDRHEIKVMSRSREISACKPQICSIELLDRGERIIVRCHTCKRGGTWKRLDAQDE